MDLLNDIQNTQELGTVETMALLAAEEYSLKCRQHVVSVLHVISELGNLIKVGKFAELDIKALQVYPYQENDGSNVIEVKMLNSEEFENEDYYPLVETDLFKPFLKISKLFHVIKNDTSFMNCGGNKKVIELTPEGLKELQNYLLSPALQTSLEKALLADAISPTTYKKETLVLKI